jgi:N-acetylglucosaminyl-diphospho-decaprenol L-rhamnosyltransferase
MTSNSGRIAILLVSYKNPGDVCACLTALSTATPNPPFEVFICENGGVTAFKELTAALLASGGPCHENRGQIPPMPIRASESLPEFQCLGLGQRLSHVWIARAAHNLGYAGAINALIDCLRSVSDWNGVWVLNPDTVPEPCALAELVEHAKIGNKGMVGSTIVDGSDNNKIRCRGGHHWVVSTARAISLGFDDHIKDICDVMKIEENLDCISGASMFVTWDCLERIGPMDERFFLYYEDLDWGLRAKHLGLGYASASVVAHKGGTTLGSSVVRRTDRSWLAIYLQYRNRVHFTRKHHPLWLPLIPFLSVLHASRYLASGAWADFAIALRGFIAGARGEIGPPSRLSTEGLAKKRPKLARARRWGLKLLIAALFWGVIASMDLVCRLLGHPRKGRLTILYYHGVQSDFVFEFRRQMEALSRFAHVVPPDFRGKLPTQKRNVAITFDDAFSSVAQNAVPELRTRSFPCAIFVPIGLIGCVPAWKEDKYSSTSGEKIMSLAQLAGLSPELITLGSHSVGHRHLTALSPASLHSELLDSRANLESLTARPVRLIAPPYGDLDRRVLQACNEAGYDFVYSTIPENVDTSMPEMLRGRVRVDPWDGPIEFFLKFNGAYGWLAYLPTFLRSAGIRGSQNAPNDDDQMVAAEVDRQ